MAFPVHFLFVQIVNVRGNHWITLSNAQNLRLEVSIYDSLHGVDKNKDNDIRYPISVEQSVCQIMRPPHDVTFLVDNVQQQEGGNDCGLFAIAFATLLCVGRDPAKERFDKKKSCVKSCFRASKKKIWPCSLRKPVALQEKKTRKFFMSGTVLFTATVECLTMAMRWCNVLPANVGFTVSAKRVILTTHNGGANRAKMYSKRSKRGKVSEKKTKTKCSNYEVSHRNNPVESKRIQELYTAIAAIYQEFQFPVKLVAKVRIFRSYRTFLVD